jgi:glycosyltransferase involved in cell wall biosynthesis
MKANNPKVSVIIPLYNCEKYIVQAVESVLSQTYNNYEIIVIDDGSKDNSRTVLQPYFDRIRYVYQSNQGVAAARNLGVEIAQGELICFLDHDDIFMPHKLATQVACVLSQPNVGMVHSGWRRVNGEGKKLADVCPWKKIPVLDLTNWLQHMPILFTAMLFKREWVEKVGGLDTQYKQASDLDLVQRLALTGCKTVWVKDILVCYREHESNHSLNTLLQAQESWTVRENFFAREDIPDRIRQMENSCRYHTLVWIAWRLFNSGHLQQMTQYLRQSLPYSQLPPTAIVLDWIECFKAYSLDYNGKFDLASLLNSRPWKSLVEPLS